MSEAASIRESAEKLQRAAVAVRNLQAELPRERAAWCDWVPAMLDRMAEALAAGETPQP